MELRKITPHRTFQDEKAVVYSTGKSVYLHSDKVPEGRTLHVLHVSASFENCATTEYIELGYWNGHAYVSVKLAKPAVASEPIRWLGDIRLKEGQFVYSKNTNVFNGEKMELWVEGYWVYHDEKEHID